MADLRGLGSRLYRGETNFDLIGSRKRWYAASLVLLTLCTASMLFRGFNFGIEFEGGAAFQFPASGKSVADARSAVGDTGVEVVSAQKAGNNFLVKTPELKAAESTEVKKSVAKAFGIDEGDVTDQSVSSSWGGQITRKALRALAFFLVVIVIYISLRFEPKMAIAAIAALIHDLWLTAGVYSIVGFEVTPSTVIGLLTILGFSLYDTVVVFDKVEENTRGLLGSGRMTYAQAANLAVNQTFMRSINTSLIALLPVAGLLFVGAGILGAGTLKDLALVLFVGLAAGAYSSLFLATPILVDLKERESGYRALRQRVAARQAGGPVRGGRGAGAAGAPAPTRRATSTAVLDRDDEPDDGADGGGGEQELVAGGARSAAPRPGQRSGSGSVRRKGGRPGRPSGKRKR